MIKSSLTSNIIKMTLINIKIFLIIAEIVTMIVIHAPSIQHKVELIQLVIFANLLKLPSRKIPQPIIELVLKLKIAQLLKVILF